ncbi:hypothetical protein ScPMuIL_005276 [Solemya velum]
MWRIYRDLVTRDSFNTASARPDVVMSDCTRTVVHPLPFKKSLSDFIIFISMCSPPITTKNLSSPKMFDHVHWIHLAMEYDASKEEDELKRKQWKFTDDTAMARSVARSLLDKKNLDVKDMAERFSEEFFKEPHRGYGGSISHVFDQLRESNYLDVFGPGRKQFDGQGSYGNGGAMRISPAALFLYNQNDFEKFKDVVEKITRVTHTHEHAVHGAILECSAVYQALHADSKSGLDVSAYIDSLIERLRPLEHVQEEEGSKHAKRSRLDIERPYCNKLEKIRQYATQEKQPSTEEINKILGTDISALRSVPTAVYAFLRTIKDIEEIEDRNPFERTIIYAISLGGDTDTIATMAGAIAGAYYGIECVPTSWQKCCEGVKDAIQFANGLHDLQS